MVPLWIGKRPDSLLRSVILEARRSTDERRWRSRRKPGLHRIAPRIRWAIASLLMGTLELWKHVSNRTGPLISLAATRVFRGWIKICIHRHNLLFKRGCEIRAILPSSDTRTARLGLHRVVNYGQRRNRAIMVSEFEVLGALRAEFKLHECHFCSKWEWENYGLE